MKKYVICVVTALHKTSSFIVEKEIILKEGRKNHDDISRYDYEIFIQNNLKLPKVISEVYYFFLND